jgi:hypothetical protein
MNEERVSMIATHALGVVAFILIAVVAERTAVWTIAMRQFTWSEPGPFLQLSEVRFWFLVAGLALLAVGSLGLAWRSRKFHAVYARVAVFSAFSCLVTAVLVMTATFLAVRGYALELTLDHVRAMCNGVVA